MTTGEWDLGTDIGDGMVKSARCAGCDGPLYVGGLRSVQSIVAKRWCSKRCQNRVRSHERFTREREARMEQWIDDFVAQQLAGPRFFF